MADRAPLTDQEAIHLLHAIHLRALKGELPEVEAVALADEVFDRVVWLEKGEE